MDIEENILKNEYFDELNQKTLNIARYVSYGSIPGLIYFIIFDLFVLNIKSLLIWRIIGFLPLILFMFLSFTLFRKNNSSVIFFYILSLTGLMIMVTGMNIIVFSNFLEPFNKLIITVISIAVIFIIFILSGGTKKFLFIILLIPMFFLVIYLMIFKDLKIQDWAYFSIHFLVSITAVFSGVIQDKISFNEFKMRKLANLRKKISERMTIEAEESKLKTQYIEKADKMKNQFLEIMSHELRTPLNSIIGFTDLLLQAENNSENKEKLNIIKDSSEVLISHINNLLDISKIESGDIKFNDRNFNLDNRLKKLVKIFSDQAKKGNNRFIIEIKEPLCQNLIGDPEIFDQILSNIVLYSIKLTQNGEIKLSIIQKKYNKKIILILLIETKGIFNDKSNIFKSFEKMIEYSKIDIYKYTGTGIGLAIVKELINKLNGKINVMHKDNRGVEIKIELKYKMSINNIENKKKHEENIDLKLDKKDRGLVYILVAEDNKYNQELMKKILELKEYKVDIAETGYEAIKKLEDNVYNLIFMDIQMPELDGYETAKFIRSSNTSFKDIPIIAITAYAMQKDKDQCKRIGFNDFIAKPIDINKIYDIIRKYI